MRVFTCFSDSPYNKHHLLASRTHLVSLSMHCTTGMIILLCIKHTCTQIHQKHTHTCAQTHRHIHTGLKGWKKGDIKLCLMTMTMLSEPPEHCFVIMTCHRKLSSTERTHKSLRHSWALVYYRKRNNKETQQTITILLTPLLYIRQNRTLISYTIEFLFCNKKF